MAAQQYHETLGGIEGENDVLPDINRFLDDIGAGNYKDKFSVNGITTEFLLTFSERDLELGDIYIFFRQFGDCICVYDI